MEEQVIGILAALDTLVEDPEVEEQRKGSKWKIRHALGPGALFMVAALISLCLLLLIVAAYNIFGKSVPQVAHMIAIILALVSQLCVLLYFVAQIWDGLKRLWNPEENFLDPWRWNVVYEARHLNCLVKYDDDALTFVAGRLGKERDHMRARLGALIGAVEKTGFLTIAAVIVSTYLALTDTPLVYPVEAFSGWWYVMIVLMGLLVFAMFAVNAIQELDLRAHLTRVAIGRKKAQGKNKEELRDAHFDADGQPGKEASV